MSTIAIDATYSVDPEPSGIAVYSRRLIESLAELSTSQHFLLCYRLSRFNRRHEFLQPASLGTRKPSGPQNSRFSTCFVQSGLTFWLPWQADLFHSLAQRPPAFRFKKEIVTVFDVFPLTGRDYSTPEFQQKFSRLLLEAVTRAQRVITASRCTADQLVRQCGIEPQKIRIIPAGVDLPQGLMSVEERRLERERWVGKGNEMILSVGAIQTRKNTLNMVKVIESLPAEFHLVLAGGNGHGSQAVHEYIRQRRLESRVKVLGYVPAEHLPSLYQAASVFLFPSLEEGFGIPVLEAMAYGTPVITSEASSLPEVGGDAALYVNPRDVMQMAGQVVRAVNDDRLRQELTRAGLERAHEFSWKRTATATLDVYNEVLDA